MGCTRAAVVASLLGWTVLLAASLPRPALSATGLPQIGATVSNAVALGRRQVPLPAGEWSIVAADFGSVEGLSPGPYGAILDVTLVQLRDRRVESIVIARTNALPVAAGWGPAAACMRRDLPYVSELRIQAYNLSCAYVEPVGLANPSMESSAMSQSAREFIAARGWSLPPTLLIAGFRIGNRRD